MGQIVKIHVAGTAIAVAETVVIIADNLKRQGYEVLAISDERPNRTESGFYRTMRVVRLERRPE